MADIDQEARKIIAKISQRDINEVTPDKLLFEDLCLDSLKGQELLSRLSQKYNIDIPDEKLAEIHTVNDVADLIKSYLK